MTQKNDLVKIIQKFSFLSFITLFCRSFWNLYPNKRFVDGFVFLILFVSPVDLINIVYTSIKKDVVGSVTGIIHLVVGIFYPKKHNMDRILLILFSLKIDTNKIKHVFSLFLSRSNFY